MFFSKKPPKCPVTSLPCPAPNHFFLFVLVYTYFHYFHHMVNGRAELRKNQLFCKILSL